MMTTEKAIDVLWQCIDAARRQLASGDVVMAKRTVREMSEITGMGEWMGHHLVAAAIDGHDARVAFPRPTAPRQSDCLSLMSYARRCLSECGIDARRVAELPTADLRRLREIARWALDGQYGTLTLSKPELARRAAICLDAAACAADAMRAVAT